MAPPGWAKIKCSWHHYLPGVLLQLLLALCFFSYLRVSQDKPRWSPESGATMVGSPTSALNESAGPMAFKGAPCQATAGPSTCPPLLLLLWTWPFNVWVALLLLGDATRHPRLPADRQPQGVPSSGCGPRASPRGQLQAQGAAPTFPAATRPALGLVQHGIAQQLPTAEDPGRIL